MSTNRRAHTTSAPIAEHGLIGNLQTAALIDTRGTVAWYCPGRFDAPSVFASLLDADRGGLFQIAPTGQGWTTRQLYLPDSAVLVTRFLGTGGVAEIVDFMPVTGRATDTPHLLVRQVRVVRGKVPLTVLCAPRFDYGRAQHKLVWEGEAAVFRAPQRALRLDTDAALEPDGDDVIANLDLSAGATAWFALVGGVDDDSTPPRVAAPEVHGRYKVDVGVLAQLGGRRLLPRPLAGDRDPIGHHPETPDLQPDPVPSSPRRPPALPEQIGGERNWDYRYTWIRDAAFSVHALLRLGYGEEARRLFTWLIARPGGDGGADGGPLQLMYRVDGSPDMPEAILDHLDGYRSSRPVRIGNGAVLQLQLDIYGELIDAIWTAYQRGGGRHPSLGPAARTRRLALNTLGPARRGHLGDPWRTQRLRARPRHVLGRSRPHGPARQRPGLAGRHRAAGPPPATPSTRRS